ncbi:MAG: amidase family protein [Anaerorhabdus sp.]
MKKQITKDSAKQVAEKTIEKLHQDQPKLNAVVSFVEVQDQLESMNCEGKLAGVMVALKDNVSTKGIRTTASSRILDNYVPVFDATITKKLKDAGAIIVAKASMDELGMGGTNLNAATGAVKNPWDLSRISGGSSGGSAALVASGAVPLAIGTDTGDSVRKPAAFCGVVGVKPTYGRISRYGIVPYASSLDHVGYFTTNVMDAAYALEVLAGRDELDMTSSLKEVECYTEKASGKIQGKTIGVLENVVESIHNEEIKNQFNELIQVMEKQGAIIKKIKLDQDLMRSILPTYYLIANCEATANHANLDGVRFGVQQEGASAEEVMANSRTAGFGYYLRQRLMVGSYGLFVENQEKLFRKAQRVRRVLVDALAKEFKEIDCLVAPAAPNIAPKVDAESTEMMTDEVLIADNFMILGNFSGYPSITLPMGFVENCPTGINLTCRPFEESEMFNIAQAFENETGLKDQVAEVK